MRVRAGSGGGGGEVPGEQLRDAVDGVVGEAGEHGEQIAFWIEAVEFGRADQNVEDGGAPSASIRAGEEVVLAT